MVVLAGLMCHSIKLHTQVIICKLVHIDRIVAVINSLTTEEVFCDPWLLCTISLLQLLAYDSQLPPVCIITISSCC